MKIAYVGIFLFPDGDAGSARVLGIAKSLRERGHEIVFFGSEKNTHGNPADSDLPIVKQIFFQGFRYCSPAYNDDSIFGRLGRQISISIGSSILERLENEARENTIDAVIAYQAPSLLSLRLMRWCTAKNIPLICDSVEWYDARQMPFGYFGPFFWDSEFHMKHIQKRIGRIIAISTYLADYYSSLGCRVVRVPVLLDPQDNRLEPYVRPNSDIAFVYAGNPGRKDLLGNVLRGVLYLREQGLRVVIKLVGVTEKGVIDCLNGDRTSFLRLGDSLVIYRRTSRAEIPQLLAQADFMALLRPKIRYADAGFPTKVVESLAAGVPVIVNLTSDLGEYLHDGENAFISSDNSVEAFIGAVHRALALRETWPKMRQAARHTALTFFDYRKYADNLDLFLKEAVKTSSRTFSPLL